MNSLSITDKSFGCMNKPVAHESSEVINDTNHVENATDSSHSVHDSNSAGQSLLQRVTELSVKVFQFILLLPLNVYNSKKDLFKKTDDQPTKQPVVLLVTGSLNPVHKGHLYMAKLAKDKLKERGIDVAKILFSPSHQGYLDKKMKKKNIEIMQLNKAAMQDKGKALLAPRVAFTAQERLKLLEEAIKHYDFGETEVAVDKMEINATGFIDHPEVREMISDREGIPTVFIAGSDLAYSMNGWKKDFPVVVIGRNDGETKISDGSLLDDNGHPVIKTDPSRNRFVIVSNDKTLEKASSSAVAAGDTSYLPDSIKCLYNKMLEKHKKTDPAWISYNEMVQLQKA